MADFYCVYSVIDIIWKIFSILFVLYKFTSFFSMLYGFVNFLKNIMKWTIYAKNQLLIYIRKKQSFNFNDNHNDNDNDTKLTKSIFTKFKERLYNFFTFSSYSSNDDTILPLYETNIDKVETETDEDIHLTDKLAEKLNDSNLSSYYDIKYKSDFQLKSQNKCDNYEYLYQNELCESQSEESELFINFGDNL